MPRATKWQRYEVSATGMDYWTTSPDGLIDLGSSIGDGADSNTIVRTMLDVQVDVLLPVALFPFISPPGPGQVFFGIATGASTLSAYTYPDPILNTPTNKDVTGTAMLYYTGLDPVPGSSDYVAKYRMIEPIDSHAQRKSHLPGDPIIGLCAARVIDNAGLMSWGVGCQFWMSGYFRVLYEL